MSKSIKFKNNVYLDSNSITYRKENLQDIIDNYRYGTVRENTVIGSWCRLFTLDLSSIHKQCNVLFMLTDAQNNNTSNLVNLFVHKGIATDKLRIDSFKCINFFQNLSGYTDITTKLVAIVTNINQVQVFYKMENANSPAINILSITRLRPIDSFGKVTVSCTPIGTSLPSGTVKYVEKLI